jgi:hypothetical protein
MNITEELQNIQNYLLDNYNLNTTIEDYYNDIKAIVHKSSKYKISFYIKPPVKNSFAPNNYLIHFHFEQKNCGNGYASIYYQNDRNEIDIFLQEHGFSKIKERQVNIFDYLEV